MKKLGFLLALILCLLVFPKSVDAASSGAAIYLDGQQLNLSSGVKVDNIKGNVMIPIRVVSENLGFDVRWDKSSRSVTVSSSDKSVRMVVGNAQAELDGELVDLNLPPVLSGDTTLVPLRFVSQQMGLDVKWDNAAKAVYLTSPVPSSPDAGTSPGSGGGSGTDSSAPGNNADLSTLTGISFSDNRLMISTEERLLECISDEGAGPHRGGFAEYGIFRSLSGRSRNESQQRRRDGRNGLSRRSQDPVCAFQP